MGESEKLAYLVEALHELSCVLHNRPDIRTRGRRDRQRLHQTAARYHRREQLSRTQYARTMVPLG